MATQSTYPHQGKSQNIMEGAADIPPPLRPETSSGSHLHRKSFQFLGSDAFAIFFLIVSLCFIFVIVVSPLYGFSGHFFRPHSARKGWDFLSVALVLFAIACGLLSRNNGDNTVHEEVYRTSNVSEQDQKTNPSTSQQWHGYSDRTDQILLHHPPGVVGNEYWRISGGPSMSNYPYPSTDSLQHCRNLQEFEDEMDIKRAARASFSLYEEGVLFSPLHQFSVPPLMRPQHCAPSVRPPTPPGVVGTEVERVNETVGRCEDGDERLEPPSLRLAFQTSEDEISKNEKEREAEGKELSSSPKRRKKKKKAKQWQKSVENFNDVPGQQHHYRNLFPPPPALVAVRHYQTPTNIDETRKDCLVPLPPQSSSKKLIAEVVPIAAKADGRRTPSSSRTQNSTCKEPPSLPIPSSLTTPELQIVMHGKYFGTTNETRSPNPEVNKGFKSKKTSGLTNASPTTNENADRMGPMFCPSPDVNSKADSFIERFRAGLKLERMNSIKERQKKRTSILGR